MGKQNKPKTVLRDMKINSVSVVDQGANQHAHILLAKRAEGEDATEQTQEKPVSNDTAFFARIGEVFAKMFHIDREKATEAIEKEAKTFANIDGKQQIFDRMYNICDAFRESVRSIIADEELTDAQKAEMISTTADQMSVAIKTDIAGKFNGTTISKGSEGETGSEGEGETPTGTDPETANPEETPAETQTAETTVAKSTTQQEGEKDMKFNTEAMSAEERAQLEDLQKRYGVEEENKATETPAAETNAESEDIYKGLHPAVKAEMESLRKFRDEAENREIMEVAKRYTIIGKKPEELAPVLKSLKAAGGSAYDDMIAVLDSAVETVEKSGVFSEIGKRGTTSSEDPWQKIEKVADEFQKDNVNLTRAQAIEKACDAHPELVREYENSRK